MKRFQDMTEEEREAMCVAANRVAVAKAGHLIAQDPNIDLPDEYWNAYHAWWDATCASNPITGRGY